MHGFTNVTNQLVAVIKSTVFVVLDCV